MALKAMQYDLDQAMTNSDCEVRRSCAASRIASHPVLFGMLIGLLLCCAIIVKETWFPWLGQDIGRHKRLLEAIFFTVFFFAVYVYFFWSWHRRRGFWTALCAFFLLHVAGVVGYSMYVHPLSPWQWSVLGFLEGYAGAFFVGWWTTRQLRREHNAQ